jgi:hypothetical protein
MAAPAEMPAPANIGNPAGGARKPTTKRTKVIDPLFAHSPAYVVLLQLWALHWRRGVPS